MAELFDMKKWEPLLLEIITKVSQCQFAKIALQYVHDFDGLVIAFPQDEK
jgi:dihydroorotase